jgi:hypothetical protein
MAIAKTKPSRPRKSAVTTKKAAPAKRALIKGIKVVVPEKKGKGACYAYTGKKLSEADTTPQFRALITSMMDIEDKSFNQKNWSWKQLIDLGHSEGHIAMPRTKDVEKQKTRIWNCYKKRLLEEGFIETVK